MNSAAFPVLIDDVPMPRSEDLPEVLKPLVRCQATRLSHDPKYVRDLIVPPAMPRTGQIPIPGGQRADYYEIAVRQFQQEIVPGKQTTVWSYLSLADPAGTQNYPAFTVEAVYNRPVWVKWVNGLVDGNGNFLPHLLPVDQTLHWANPPGGTAGRDDHGTARTPYRGPVPIVTHVHGAHTTDESDGYAEAWYLPVANNIPADFAKVGTFYETFRQQFLDEHGADWQPGSTTFQYGSPQRSGVLGSARVWPVKQMREREICPSFRAAKPRSGLVRWHRPRPQPNRRCRLTVVETHSLPICQ